MQTAPYVVLIFYRVRCDDLKDPPWAFGEINRATIPSAHACFELYIPLIISRVRVILKKVNRQLYNYALL